MVGEAFVGWLSDSALDTSVPPGPWSVPLGVTGGLRVERGVAQDSKAGRLVGRLGLVSGWQLRRLLQSAVADRGLPGRLVRAGILTAYVVEGPVRLPRLYGPGVRSDFPSWEVLNALNQVAANEFLIRLLSLGPARGAAFWTTWGNGLSVIRGRERFTVLAFREGREEEERFLAFLGLVRPGDGKLVVVAASVRHLVRLSQLARERVCPLCLSWDGALFNLPLARAFCRVGTDGPIPVLMSGLEAVCGRDYRDNQQNKRGINFEQGSIDRPFGPGTRASVHSERYGRDPSGAGR